MANIGELAEEVKSGRRKRSTIGASSGGGNSNSRASGGPIGDSETTGNISRPNTNGVPVDNNRIERVGDEQPAIGSTDVASESDGTTDNAERPTGRPGESAGTDTDRTNRSDSIGQPETPFDLGPVGLTPPFVVESSTVETVATPKRSRSKSTIGQPGPVPKAAAIPRLSLDGATCARVLAMGFGITAMQLGEHWSKSTEECLPVGEDMAELLKGMPVEIVDKLMSAMPAFSFCAGMAMLVSEPLKVQIAINNANTGKNRNAQTKPSQAGTPPTNPGSIPIIASYPADIG